VSAALFARERGGGGQRLDVSMLDVSIAFLWVDSAGTATLLDADPALAPGVTTGIRCLRFADGWGVVTPVADDDFSGMCRAFGVAGAEDPVLSTAMGRAMNRERMTEVMVGVRDAAAAMTTAVAAERLLAEGAPFGIVLSVGDVPHDPHVRASGLFAETVHPRAGRIREPRPPVRFGGRLTEVPGHSPAIGEHTDEILDALGRHDGAALRRAGVVASPDPADGTDRGAR
jgi:crotonobetainyl-CoA:carnitine CoA-transferase CaiB-like acyl-CoA transferase